MADVSAPDPWADREAWLLTPEERDLILLVRAEQAKRDARGPTDDMEDPDQMSEPPLPRAEVMR